MAAAVLSLWLVSWWQIWEQKRHGSLVSEKQTEAYEKECQPARDVDPDLRFKRQETRPGFGVWTALHGGIKALARAAAIELAPIRVDVVSPADVLRAATIEAAHHADLEKRFGSVIVGKRADLVLLEANPLDDIANTRRIRAVFLNGWLHDLKQLDRLLAFGRAQANAPANWMKLLWGFARSSVSAEL